MYVFIYSFLGYLFNFEAFGCDSCTKLGLASRMKM